jgi:chemotaxis protein CheD
VDASEVLVRMGELATSIGHGPTLVSIGLGSCIGLALLDRPAGVVGLAHVMLPEAPPEGDGGTPGRFADCAVPALIEAMERHGARPGRLEAVVVGGARMFEIGSSLDIGARNEAAALEALEAAGIPVRATETRGSVGRTIRVRPTDGTVTVKAAGGTPTTIFGG